MRGPGETQIETDRRIIQQKVALLKQKLLKIDKQMATQRGNRGALVRVALVGYTNAGKSTLFNTLTGADILAKDMLFATLDPTMRGVKLPDGGPEVILSDTVGFISDLPTELVASFRATLEEVLSANLVLHVRDISHPESAEQAKEVQNILTSLGLKEDVPLLEVWNKIDRVDPEAREGMLERARRDEAVFAISAITGEGMAPLLDGIAEKLGETRYSTEMLLPFADGKRRAWLHAQDVVDSEDAEEDGYRLRVLWTARQEKRFREM